MFKHSLFSKLLIIYTTVLIMILVVISGVLRYSFQRLYYLDEFRRLENSATEIADIFLQYNNGDLSFLEFQVGVRTFSRSTNALVLITDLQGQIVFNSTQVMSGHRDHIGQRSTLEESFMPQLQKAVSGNTVREVWSSRDTGDSALNLFLPLYSGDTVLGCIIVSQPVQDITHIVKRVNNLIWIVGLAGSVFTIFILSIVSKSFSKPITVLNNAALSMASGKFTPIYVKTEDELGQLAKSFNYMGEQFAKQEENQREFLSTVSHELRTPLTSTLGFIQGMIDGVIDKNEQDHYLKITVSEIKRVISLTNDLLDLERIKQGQIELYQNYFDLVGLLQECIEQLKPLSKDMNVTINLTSPSESVIVADRNRLKQVFVNLLDNGIRHASSTININLVTSNKGHILEVSDDGKGIAPEDANYLFERFYKADKSRSTKASGAGLGLAIAKNLLELHGGDISIVPSDAGAKFKISLPQ